LKNAEELATPSPSGKVDEANLNEAKNILLKATNHLINDCQKFFLFFFFIFFPFLV